MIGLVHELPGGIVRIVILPFVWSGCLVVLAFFSCLAVQKVAGVAEDG